MQPLYEKMHEILLNESILHANETPLEVLCEPGRSAILKSYMWLYRTGKHADKAIRNRQEKLAFLQHARWGANSSAIVYSIIETAKENNLKPYDYLGWLFEKIRSVGDVETFLPWSEDLPENLKLKSV